MIVYRICKTKYSGSLFASGRMGRWNSLGNYVIYCAENRSLACLENLVHSSFESLQADFSLIEIEIPKGIKISSVSASKLYSGWNEPRGNYQIRQIGDKWYEEKRTCVQKVPTALVTGEFNFILNTLHPDFKRIRIRSAGSFTFDPRIKT